VGRFAQHTRLVATHGNTDRLAGKFLESVELQQEKDMSTVVAEAPQSVRLDPVAGKGLS
jgi:hypothetical protein